MMMLMMKLTMIKMMIILVTMWLDFGFTWLISERERERVGKIQIFEENH